jgi:hypothetical protein
MINPWTGKTKPNKNTGIFNYLIDKYYPELTPSKIENEHINLIEKIDNHK